jgi:hypothetical protein
MKSARARRLSRPVTVSEPFGGKNHASITAAMPAAAIPLLDPPSFAISKTESKSASRALFSKSSVINPADGQKH